MIERLVHDVRHGIRILTRSPGPSAAAALLIALVIGGNTTIYAMLNGVVRRPAPGVQAKDLVSFDLVGAPGAPFFALEDYAEYAEQTKTLRSLAAFTFNRTVVATPNGSYLLNTAPVTANYFDTIGVRPALRRSFTEAETREGTALVGGDRRPHLGRPLRAAS